MSVPSVLQFVSTAKIRQARCRLLSDSNMVGMCHRLLDEFGRPPS